MKPAATLRGGIKIKPVMFLRANQLWVSLISRIAYFYHRVEQMLALHKQLAEAKRYC